MNLKNTDFEYLYNEILQNIETSCNELCGICKLSMDKYSIITLDCKHKYHVDCLLNSLKKNIKECPYCREKININNYKSQCCKIIKIGTQCKNKVYNDEKICQCHTKLIGKNKNIENNIINKQIIRKTDQINKLQNEINY